MQSRPAINHFIRTYFPLDPRQLSSLELPIAASAGEHRKFIYLAAIKLKIALQDQTLV